MGNLPSVEIETELLAPITATPFLNHALLTFVPSTSDFLAGFTGTNQTWMFKGADQLGLVAALGPNDWRGRLKSMGALTNEPVYLAVEAHFNPQAVADANGIRDAITLPEVVYIGRRTRAVISQNTVEFSNNTEGSVNVKVNQSGFLFPSADPVGALADVTIESDGVLTVTQLATALAAALNAIPEFAAAFSATPALGVVTIASDIAGYPLITSVTPSTPGPTMVLKVTTANTPDDYGSLTDGDLTDMQAAAEIGPLIARPTRRWYWITDLQGDDIVNSEGMEWVENQGDKTQFLPIRPYQFMAWSTTGEKVIFIGADKVGNFDPLSTDSAAAIAKTALNNEGWHRAGVTDHDRYGFAVPALLGRTIGYLPGEISFTSKVLYGSVLSSRMDPRDHGDNEYLSAERTFNWYGAEGARGSMRWGYLADGSFADRKWLEDYTTYLVREALIAWMQRANIIPYADDSIEAGAGIISLTMAQIPAINAETIVVTFLKRSQVSSNDIALRRYNFYQSFAATFGIINSIGSLADPIKISLVDA